ncbi:MAG: hypothetical protein Q4F66_09930 [Clostridium sp.]|nr:hypothetical protein [Clostridium sp.]
MITATLDSSINLLIAILLVSGILLIVLLLLYWFCEAYDYVDEKKDKLIEDHKKIFEEKGIILEEKVKSKV